jgi:hypothetical protein
MVGRIVLAAVARVLESVREDQVYVAVSSPECRPKSRRQNSKQIVKNVSQLKYLGTTVRNKKLIQEEIERILKSGNAC